ncbi:long-subunit fatty acid transport protein [Mariniflexile fucanivorans]|uniref:Long-subunit fatty acid transport protein n=1 Tax=Mariniflexile fucanivorans TaxID=264023 RepID=A0A4R1RIQ2_9FLAO|nr:hypothetical protein [Mariniflexile fucanivorans]TCL65981.1 long-subunit fatty acid transport protein [Mariniflexile fucanivorans]
MIKKLVLVFIAIFAINSYGQQGTASPYSFYGIGSLKFKGTVENRSMGGLSIYNDSIHINLRNPAGYAGKNLEMLNGESRPVKFTVGGSYSDVELKSNSGSAKASATTFDYLALSIPMGKFGFGFGLMPYTAVGYKLETLDDNYDDGKKSNRFRGEGGLNKAFLGFGYQITDELSVGIDAQYNFGNIQNSNITFSYDEDGNTTQYQSRENNRSDLSGLNINLGLSYKTMINTNLELVTGLTYTPKSILSSKNERSISTIILSSTGSESVYNTIDTDLESLGLLETDLVLPSKFSVGAGVGEPRKWFVGVESEYQKTSDFSNDLYNSSAVVYKDAASVSIGGFYIPQYNSFTSYFKRAVYRAGLHYENTGLNIENESINEFGISFGVGLPVGSFFSNANLGMELGKRGTTNSNLIQENFINFQISLSLNDRWFQKRKYD